MTTKDKVLQIVKNNLGATEGNLYRANMQFGKMSKDDLEKEYGESGRTCDSILQGYRDSNEEAKQCVSWVESAT